MPSSPSERLVRIRIAGFRGVADELEIGFRDRRSKVLFAGNGIGKSTIADAIEYYFTTKVESLRRENREHCIPHLNPRQATLVEIQTTGVLGGSVGYPHPGAKTPAVIIGRSELFLLRGTDLAEFMDENKREKARTLSRILGFEDVDELRADLQTTMNELADAARSARAAAGQGAAGLRKAGVTPDTTAVLIWIQNQCATVGAQPPSSMGTVLDETWQPVASTPAMAAVAKRTALAADLEGIQVAVIDEAAIGEWNAALASETADHRASRPLLEAASKKLVTHSTPECPLCGQRVSLADLRVRVANALSELEASSKRFRAADAAIQRLAADVRTADGLRTTVARRAAVLGVVLPKVPASPAQALDAARDAQKTVDPKPVVAYAAAVSAWDDSARAAGATLTAQSLGQTTTEPARLGAVVAMTRTWAATEQRALVAESAHAAAKEIHDAYASAFRVELEAVLAGLSSRAAELYARLHPGEGAVGGLTVEMPNDKSIEIGIDFHGSRQRPPNGVLSESHVASLGLSVFLAMAEVVNEKLGFLILDDPVSTFDADHRARLADVLVQEFDDRQLLVLTHDPLFYRRLARSAGWTSLEFTSWSFDGGPTGKELDPDLLARARSALAEGDVQVAATRGRRALEEILKEICEKLKAPVPFKRGIDNDVRVAEELLAALRGHLKDKAKHIKAELDSVLQDLDTEISVAFNVETHASVFSASPSEVGTALDHVATLAEYFKCSECGTPVWRHGTPASFQCKCGKRTLSLDAVTRAAVTPA